MSASARAGSLSRRSRRPLARSSTRSAGVARSGCGDRLEKDRQRRIAAPAVACRSAALPRDGYRNHPALTLSTCSFAASRAVRLRGADDLPDLRVGAAGLCRAEPGIAFYGRGGSCCNVQVLPSGSLKVTKEPHGWTSTSLTSTPRASKPAVPSGYLPPKTA
jgi:hypothetical protein